MNPLPPNNRRPPPHSVEYLVTEGLGYCCLYFFFSRFTRREDIQYRLGIAADTCKEYKKKMEAGELTCLHRESCIRQRLINAVRKKDQGPPSPPAAGS